MCNVLQCAHRYCMLNTSTDDLGVQRPSDPFSSNDILLCPVDKWQDLFLISHPVEVCKR
uniref:Uncharacterized protein n=1 Tax=Anguilla anguilla TaxID=7936 RepID=A0A0E9T847_ANGAN